MLARVEARANVLTHLPNDLAHGGTWVGLG